MTSDQAKVGVVRRSTWFFALLAIVLGGSQTTAQTRELYSDTWVAADALGRSLPTAEEVGAPRANKTVGMFYFLWHGFHGDAALYDNTQLLQTNPTNPAYGPEGAFHWWGEPEAGYYRATDPWVIRRNASMMVDAGVDFIYLDASNGFTYSAEFTALADTYLQIRNEGGKTPQIAFLTRNNSPATIDRIQADYYTNRDYSELWFEWEDKPLMLGYPDQDGQSVSQRTRDTFTFRESWAWDAGENKWQWIDQAPQDYGWSGDPNHPEQIPAAIASHPTNNRGTSYSNGQQPAIDQYGLTPFTGEGRHFEEQLDHALAVDPDVLFITGFNEWVAQRKIADTPRPFLGQTLPVGGTYFVDAYNQEFNRDIEPMRGGHTDNYYYQLVDAVRRYKGVETLPDGERRQMSIDGSFSDWDLVSNEYRDTVGDIAHRDWDGWGGIRYINTTGRNDLLNSKVSNDSVNAYFTIETAETITPHTDDDWMMLLIDADQDSSTGWNGYDYVVNRSVIDGDTTTLEHTTDGVTWMQISELDFAVVGERLELAIPLDLLGQSPDAVTLDFHWIDNAPIDGEFELTFTSGDSAPNRRFNYRYTASAALPGDVNSDGLVDLTDIATLRDNLFLPATSRAEGDLNGDGFVDFDDFREWKRGYELGGLSTTTVPEPASVALAVMLLAARATFSPTREG